MRVTLILITLLLLVTAAFAAVPQQISYQGRLTSATNTPITGAKNLTFRIYDGSGMPIWNSGAVAITCTDGLFSINLGAPPQPALPVGVFLDSLVTLGITVESDPELSPRTRLTSAPYSFGTNVAPRYLPLTGGIMTGGISWDFVGHDISLSGNGDWSLFKMDGPMSGTDVALRATDEGGSLELWDPGSSAYASLSSIAGQGSSLELRDVTGLGYAKLSPIAGENGSLAISSGTGYQPFLLGSPTAGPHFDIFSTVAKNVSLSASSATNGGGRMVLRNNAGDSTAILAASGDGSTLFMYNKLKHANVTLHALDPFGGFIDLYDNAGSPEISLLAGGAGTGSVTLPDSAIDSREIEDEPGTAFNFSNGNVILTTTMQDLTTVTITIPTSGYILLSGKVGEIDLAGTTGENWANVQIDETAGGTTNNYYAAAVGGGSYPDVVWHAFTASTQRAYYKTAGTYTFRLEALRGPASNPAGTARAFYPALTAVFYPTSYGTTTAPVAADEAGQFERATAIRPSEPSGTGMTSTNMYEVDLRELELKAAKARAEAEKAERQLFEAKLRQQTSDQANR